MGPQNQVGIHETTNLFTQKETVFKTLDSLSGPRHDFYVAAVNADIIDVKENSIEALFELSSIPSLLLWYFLWFFCKICICGQQKAPMDVNH